MAHVPLLSLLAAFLGVLIFTKGFFLHRHELPHHSSCQDVYSLLRDDLHLSNSSISLLEGSSLVEPSSCLSPSLGAADEVMLIVVDALRFDFANTRLPLVMSRFPPFASPRTMLSKFVADPPTVTTQRLKGLTTGGLPTFSEITKSFSAGVLEEDNIIYQIQNANTQAHQDGNKGEGKGNKKGNKIENKMTFVGDDTWFSLFPTQFDDPHPYPSFNTRDLNTVDDGCIEHLPQMLSDNSTRLMVVHFLGVDHVGHTYGPNGPEMVAKLNRMDAELLKILDTVESESERCVVAFVFGDHGMTEGGNHGGGSDEETVAALFAHFSPGCEMGESVVDGDEIGAEGKEGFEKVNQIDLVPTISMLLGVPVPFANLGSLVPALVPLKNTEKKTTHTQQVALGLALNSAQVKKYLSTYSKIASLPSKEVTEMEEVLKDAVAKYEEAIQGGDGKDSIAYREACALFKIFLAGITDLGRKVWTNFDFSAITIGLVLLFASLMPLGKLAKNEIKEVDAAIAFIFVFFHSVLLVMSNSYIEYERQFCQLALALVSMSVVYRQQSFEPLVIPLLSRLHDLVEGHGHDVALHKFVEHQPACFVPFLAGLFLVRFRLKEEEYSVKSKSMTKLSFCLLLGEGCLYICLAISWIQKFYGSDGHLLATVTMVGAAALALAPIKGTSLKIRSFQFTLIIMTLTGPSSAPSALIVFLQFSRIMAVNASPVLVASLLKFATRHVFFATGHACSFNMLQYSAAFVWRDEFTWWSGAFSLGTNSFGWEVLSLMFIWSQTISASAMRKKHFRAVSDWYGWFQIGELFGACLSVTIMCRHLMVWAVFAPRYCFATIFGGFNFFPTLLGSVTAATSNSRIIDKPRKD